jgi:hypothetical protein
MKRIKSLPLNSRFIFFVGVTMCTIVVGVGAWSSTSPFQQKKDASLEEIRENLGIDKIPVKNNTRAFDVVSIEKTGMGDLQLVFRNGYEKKITGFQVTVGGARIQTELILGGDEREFIIPGATYQKIYMAQEGLDRHGITIRAVVFEDGSADGEPKFIEEIKDYRLGLKIERQRVLELLQGILALPDADMSVALEELEAKIPSLPQRKKSRGLDNIALGMNHERRRILGEIKKIRLMDLKRDNNSSYTEQTIKPKQNLEQLVEFYERIITKANH